MSLINTYIGAVIGTDINWAVSRVLDIFSRNKSREYQFVCHIIR